MKKLLFILLLSFVSAHLFGQTDTTQSLRPVIKETTAIATPKILSKPARRKLQPDTTRSRFLDSLKIPSDTNITGIDSILPPNSNNLVEATVPVIVKKPFDSFYVKMLDNPYFRAKAKPVYLIANERKVLSKDQIFYLLSGLLLFLAFIKLLFSKYLKNLFKLFFQPTFRQKQTREQLAQGAFPSLLLNMFFILSMSIYASFLLKHYNLIDIDLWMLLLYSAAALLILYIGKYIFLSFAGWVFNVKEATETYIFIVYLINKIIGVLLIPFILIIAFSQPELINISITISIMLVAFLFLYRYIASFAPVTKVVKVRGFHFFLYICAFEIVPLLLIYKTLIIYLQNTM